MPSNKYNIRAIQSEINRCICLSSYKTLLTILKKSITSSSSSSSSADGDDDVNLFRQVIYDNSTKKKKKKNGGGGSNLLHTICTKVGGEGCDRDVILILDIVKLIVETVPNVLYDQEGKKGRTPLHIVIQSLFSSSSSSSLSVASPLIKYLLQAAAANDNTQYLLSIKDYKNVTPLYLAAKLRYRYSSSYLSFSLQKEEELNDMLLLLLEQTNAQDFLHSQYTTTTREHKKQHHLMMEEKDVNAAAPPPPRTALWYIVATFLKSSHDQQQQHQQEDINEEEEEEETMDKVLYLAILKTHQGRQLLKFTKNCNNNKDCEQQQEAIRRRKKKNNNKMRQFANIASDNDNDNDNDNDDNSNTKKEAKNIYAMDIVQATILSCLPLLCPKYACKLFEYLLQQEQYRNVILPLSSSSSQQQQQQQQQQSSQEKKNDDDDDESTIVVVDKDGNTVLHYACMNIVDCGGTLELNVNICNRYIGGHAEKKIDDDDDDSSDEESTFSSSSSSSSSVKEQQQQQQRMNFIQYLLTSNPKMAQHVNTNKELPLHTALSSFASSLSSLTSFQQQQHHENNNNNNIHIFKKAIQDIINVHPKALQKKNRYDELPLHMVLKKYSSNYKAAASFRSLKQQHDMGKKKLSSSSSEHTTALLSLSFSSSSQNLGKNSSNFNNNNNDADNDDPNNNGNETYNMDTTTNTNTSLEEIIWRGYPEALEIYDDESGLYPFQLAAAFCKGGDRCRCCNDNNVYQHHSQQQQQGWSCIDSVYTFLRESPQVMRLFC